MATRVEELMTPDPVILDASEDVRRAAAMMRERDIGDVLVEEDGTLRGIVTDRDLVARVLADGADPSAMSVGEVCSGELVTVAPGDTLQDAVRTMRSKAIRRVPVVDDGVAVGILSIGDLAVTEDPESALADISAAPGNA